VALTQLSHFYRIRKRRIAMLANIVNGKPPGKAGRFSLALDTWAVIFALALALAVRLNVLARIPW
jgi:hypothetical protein